MISYSPAASRSDLLGILQLQQENLALHLSTEEILQQGFVTVEHHLEDLERMHLAGPSIIAKENNRVIAYVLAMTLQARDHIPILEPMFMMFEHIEFQGKPLLEIPFIMIGQVCVDRPYRGQGVFEKCYETFRDYFQSRYAFALTEIAVRNQRSIRAHSRIGFTTLCTYSSPDGETWQIVTWHWN